MQDGTETIALRLPESVISGLVLAALSGAKPEISMPMGLPAIGQELQGGLYAGIARGFDGAPDAPLILLPGEFTGKWQDAMKWAEEQGGVLPDRREGALLYANLHDQFKPEWHWLRTEYSSDGAWCQYFNCGYQLNCSKDGSLRARAVRRLIIN